MHVGMGVIFQGMGEGRTDRNVYRNELRLGDLAEPLGFESIWGVEHHFTDYTMCPDVLQFLTYFAGRTQRIQLGSMVVVLPWHDPLRVAEQVAVLDHMSNGRFILGIGRGLGRVEFEGFGVDQEREPRALRRVARRCSSTGSRRGVVEYDGQVREAGAPRDPPAAVQVVPRPHLRRRGLARVVGDHGAARDRHPDHPAEAVGARGEGARRLPRGVPRGERRRRAAADRRRAGRSATRTPAAPRSTRASTSASYYHSVIRHYELDRRPPDEDAGYESYKARAGARERARRRRTRCVEFFLGLQVWGTPEQCYEKIVDTIERTGGEAFTGVFSYGGMPYEIAEANLRLFAAEVMPELKKRVPLEDQRIAQGERCGR